MEEREREQIFVLGCTFLDKLKKADPFDTNIPGRIIDYSYTLFPFKPNNSWLLAIICNPENANPKKLKGTTKVRFLTPTGRKVQAMTDIEDFLRNRYKIDLKNKDTNVEFDVVVSKYLPPSSQTRGSKNDQVPKEPINGADDGACVSVLAAKFLRSPSTFLESPPLQILETEIGELKTELKRTILNLAKMKQNRN